MPQRCTSYKRVFSSALGRYVKRCKTLKGTKRGGGLRGLGRKGKKKKGRKCTRFGRSKGRKVCREFGGVSTRRKTKLGRVRGVKLTCRQYAIYPGGHKRCARYGKTRSSAKTRPGPSVRQGARKPKTKYTYKSGQRPRTPASKWGKKGYTQVKRRPLRGLSGRTCTRFKRVRVKGKGMQRRCAKYK